MSTRFDITGDVHEKYDWCLAQFGPPKEELTSEPTFHRWTVHKNGFMRKLFDEPRAFIIYEDEDAMAFKLRWL